MHKRGVFIGNHVPVNVKYGTYYEFDRLVDSKDVNDRIRCVKEFGYGVDKLKDDADPRVRLEVAKRGYYINQFITDSDSQVRSIAQKVLG